MPTQPPLVILGLDAGDPELIEQFASEGHLPTIKSIMDKGWHARTSGPDMFAEHGVWAGIASGNSREKMGYYYFRQLKPGSYDIVPVHGVDTNSTPFWNRLAGTDRKVAIVDVPDVAPVSGLSGAQLLNWAIHLGWVTTDPRYEARAEPAGLLNEAREVFGPRQLITEDSHATVEQDKELLGRFLRQIEKKGELCRHLIAKNRYGLVFAVFHEVHTATHQFWKYRPQAEGTDDYRNDPTLRNAIRDAYAATDRELGKLLSALPADSNVVIVGTVGFKDYYPTTGLGSPLMRMLGYQFSPPSRVSFKPMDLARRILPESVRVALSKGLSREAREKIVAEQFRNNTDWSRTTAFALPTFYKTYIRVNLRGREPQGIVEPGKPYLDLLERLEQDFRQLIDPRTGKSPIASIDRAVDLFGNEPPTTLPDLFVEWNAPHFLSRLTHPRGEITQERPEWYRPSDHSQQGFVAAMGPGFSARGKQSNVTITDLAPTFLALLSLPSDPEMRGRPLPVMG